MPKTCHLVDLVPQLWNPGGSWGNPGVLASKPKDALASRLGVQVGWTSGPPFDKCSRPIASNSCMFHVLAQYISLIITWMSVRGIGNVMNELTARVHSRNLQCHVDRHWLALRTVGSNWKQYTINLVILQQS